MAKKLVAVNERGLRIGQSHPRAKLTDTEVELVRLLHERHGFGYRRLAEKFEIGVSTARDICRYWSRAQIPSGWRVIDR